MTVSNPLSPDSPLADPIQAILGRLDLMQNGLQDLTPLLDLLNRPEEGEPIRQLAALLQALTETATALKVAIRDLPGLLAANDARLTALEEASARRHQEQMDMLHRLLQQFDAAG
jgi:ABC-type transporter Mla subunit MlaD